jgi:DMSO/TMAO reductase YedYZ molybdopterin-dependent catalytic subunit
VNRRLFVASSIASLGLAGCAQAKTSLTTGPFGKVLDAAETVNYRVIGTRGMARLYTDADVNVQFRLNGLNTPADTLYSSLAARGFLQYELAVGGLVDRPQRFNFARLRAMPQQTQITRLDCVEGWSQIGKWRGVPLAAILALAHPKPEARYVVFRSFNSDDQGTPFYGSLDLHEAAHPQTILALDLNDKPLDLDHGAPVRLRIPTQLGYKSTKWVSRIDVLASFAHIGAGNGGYWEDQGYEWYAGI